MLLSDNPYTAFPSGQPLSSGMNGLSALQEIYGLAALAANAKAVARKASIAAAVSSGQTRAQAVKTVNVATRTANQAARAATQLAKKAGVPPPIIPPATTPTSTPTTAPTTTPATTPPAAGPAAPPITAPTPPPAPPSTPPSTPPPVSSPPVDPSTGQPYQQYPYQQQPPAWSGGGGGGGGGYDPGMQAQQQQGYAPQQMQQPMPVAPEQDQYDPGIQYLDSADNPDNPDAASQVATQGPGQFQLEGLGWLGEDQPGWWTGIKLPAPVGAAVQSAFHPEQGRFGLTDQLIPNVPNQTLYAGVLGTSLLFWWLHNTSGHRTAFFGKTTLMVAGLTAAAFAVMPFANKFMGGGK